MSTIKERMLLFAKNEGISFEDFAESLDMTYGNFKGIAKTRPINSDAIEILITKNPKINIEWLLTGSGEMLLENNIGYSKEHQLRKSTLNSGVPYYNEKVTATITTSFENTPQQPDYFINIPPLNDCDAYFTIRGDSMYPKYRSGEIIGVKTITNYDAILWGESYLVITDSEANDLRTVKNIFQHREEDKIILQSSNPNFRGETIICKKNILSIHLVKANINITHN